jgi:uncharacterized protein
MSLDFANTFGLEVWQIVSIIIIAGFFQGFINTIAGAGTVITYSLFVALGMPSNIANGTVRIGVIMQTLTSSLKFYKNSKLDLKKGLVLCIPVIIGSIAGASFAVNIDKSTFEIIVGALLTILLITMITNPKKWIEGKKIEEQKKNSLTQLLLFFVIGFYGGFIHIGVGIFILSALVLNAGYDIVKANAIKVFLVFMYIPFALIVFIINDQITYLPGIIAAVGNLVGGYLGTIIAIKKGSKFIRLLVMIIMGVFILHLFGLTKYLF